MGKVKNHFHDEIEAMDDGPEPQTEREHVLYRVKRHLAHIEKKAPRSRFSEIDAHMARSIIGALESDLRLLSAAHEMLATLIHLRSDLNETADVEGLDSLIKKVTGGPLEDLDMALANTCPERAISLERQAQFIESVESFGPSSAIRQAIRESIVAMERGFVVPAVIPAADLARPTPPLTKEQFIEEVAKGFAAVTKEPVERWRDYATNSVDVFLDDEKIEFGDPSFDWNLSGAQVMVEEDVACWGESL